MRLLAMPVVVGLLTMTFAGFAWATGLGCPVTSLPAAGPVAEMVQDFDASLVGVDLPVGDLGEQPMDTHACTGQIRPGAHQSNGCTLSWVFRDQTGALYQTTAGHCTSSIGQRIGADGVGAFGSVVWRVNGGVGNDMALIRIDTDKYNLVNPTLCHWGGPTGIATPADSATGPTQHDLMLHYGWGVMWSGQETRARAGYIPGPSGPAAPTMSGSGWFADGSVRMKGFTDGGDSGSPMMLKSGLAAAVHTHRLDAAPNGYGIKAATRLDMMLPRVEAGLGLDLAIVPGEPVDLVVP